MEADPASRLIARLVAGRYLPRRDAEVTRLLVDAGFRQEVEARLAACGLRLLDHPFAEHVAVALARQTEGAVFDTGAGWQASNVGLSRDAVAALVLIWALIILPKRERQWGREADGAAAQGEMFDSVVVAAARDDLSRGLPESVLLEDYGKLLGGQTRVKNFVLPVLSRLGFIERRDRTIHEGPLLDLVFDYAEMAPRILEGALADVLRGRAAAAPAADTASTGEAG